MVVFCIASFPAGAAGFDGSTPILCALTEAVECDSESGCEATTVEGLDLPHFFKIDFKANIATGIGPAGMKGSGHKMTPINTVKRTDGTIILQGIEVRGWSAVVNGETGKMSMAVSGDDEAFVLFGACTEL